MARPRKLDYEEIFALRKSGMTYREISQKCGSYTTFIGKICRENGIKPYGDYGREQHKKAQIDIVLDYIVKNGGVLGRTLKKLDIELCPETVRTAAARRGINLRDYYHFGKENKNWRVAQPGYTRHETGYVQVIGTCKHCGHKQEMRVSSIDISKTAPVCHRCAGMGYGKL